MFEAEVLLLVDSLQIDGYEAGCNAEAGKHDQRNTVVKLGGRSAFGVGVVQNLAIEQREEPETDVLNPEDQSIGRTDNLLVNQFGDRGPQGSGHQREGGAEHKDGQVGHHDTRNGAGLELRQNEGESQMADHQQDGANHQHGSGLTFGVDIVAEDGSDGHSQQREHGEDGLFGAAHVAHVAVDNQGHNGQTHQTIFHVFVLLHEVARERGSCHDKHDDVLHDGSRRTCPERAFGSRSERQVALQHVDGIFLEGEDGTIIEHAEQGHQPESEAGEDLAQVANLEWVVFFLSLAGLSVEFLVHEEIDDEHDEGDAEEHHAESHRTAHVDAATKMGEEGGENHAGGHTQTGQSHLAAHSHGSFAAFEPLDDSAAHGDACHLAAATENHEATCSQLGRCGHAAIEGRDAKLVKKWNVVQIVGEPVVESRMVTHLVDTDERLADGEIFNDTTHQHHGARKHSGETHTHLVENDTGEDEEEHKDIEEHLRALHRAKGQTVPAACILHQVLDRRQNVHKYIAAEHGQRQQQQRCPTHSCAVSQCFDTCLCHTIIV